VSSLLPVSTRAVAADVRAVTPVLTLLLALSAGVAVVNLAASQPISAQIGHSLGSTPAAVGMISMLTFLGYAVGVVFLLPLIDKIENRRLILLTLIANVLALLGAASAPSEPFFLGAAFLVGATSCVAQMCVVTAALLSPESVRGRVVGSVMSGLMIGILLSRPLGSFIAGEVGWRAVYGLSAVAGCVLVLLHWRLLPGSTPAAPRPYLASLTALWPLLAYEPVLRRRVIYQSLLMVSFSAFWTAIAWRLAQPPFNLGTRGVALFSLAGVGGAIVAPVAGRAGDRGLTRAATLWAHLAVMAGILLAAAVAGDWGQGHLAGVPIWLQLVLLAFAAVVLDMGVVADQALGRRAINMIRPESRGSVNGLYSGMFFVGAALGAVLAGVLWFSAGWGGVCALALGAALLACVLRLREPRFSRGTWHPRAEDAA
jgi:predicted MFS family arabinose efflux permease